MFERVRVRVRVVMGLRWRFLLLLEGMSLRKEGRKEEAEVEG